MGTDQERNRRRNRIWNMLSAFFLIAAAAGGQIRLEQILNAPFQSQLTAAPAGDRVAWVVNDRGARNIWVAEGPDFKPRRLTRYSEDDGMELSGLAWTPTGQALLYVRGGAANVHGETPNPRSLPAGTEQAIWMVSLSGGDPRRLDQGSQPAVSPNGDRAVYVKKGQIWSVLLDGDPKPVQLVEARGECDTPRWSPDGSLLAFVSLRGTHSFIGVYSPARQELRYLDPSVDRDSEPVWSPDGNSIAFLRIPYTRALEVFGPKREATPWSIRIAGVTTGAGRELWRAPQGRGSVFRPLSSPNQLLWTIQNRIVFPGEGDGWMHLYSISAAGGEAVLLTPGDGEVEQAVAGSDQREILFCSNHGDLHRRHLWRVPAEGGKPVPLTSGESIEWSPVQTARSAQILFLRADARTPAHPAILRDGKPVPLSFETLPPDFPAAALVSPQPVSFRSPDGLTIHAQMFRPASDSEGARLPAILFLHGGPRRQMLLGWHPAEYYHKSYAFNQYLASRGFIVLSVNFRSGTGYGLEFREAVNYGAAGASEFRDVVAAAEWLRSRADVDPKRIGLWGGSYGGYLTALGLARRSDLFAAGVDFHGVHDWRTETKLFLDTDDLETQQAALRLAFASSPMADVKGWRSPVLLIHGDDDRNVEFRQTVQLADALRRQGVDFEQLIFPDEVHSFLTHSRWVEAFQTAADFLERRLAARP